MRIFHIVLILGFIALYSAFIFFVDINIEFDIASELMVASVFFFALFSGFFIARQNDRYTRIIDIIAERDGLFSYLYRVFGVVPRMQSEMREIIKTHYTKILERKDKSDLLGSLDKTFIFLRKMYLVTSNAALVFPWLFLGIVRVAWHPSCW